MKTKRLIAIFIILAIVTLIVILGSVVFTVQSVSVDFLTTRIYSQNITDEEIISTANIPYSKSVFTLEKEVYAQALEKQYPYLKVESIETKFPNKISIHLSEREPLYAININDTGDYAILDKELKVLQLSTSDFSLFLINIIIVDLHTACVKDNFIRGEFVNFEEGNALKNIAYFFDRYGYDNLSMRTLIKDIEFDVTAIVDRVDCKIAWEYGIDTAINNIDYAPQRLIGGAITKYQELKDANISDKIVTIYIDSEDSLCFSIVDKI